MRVIVSLGSNLGRRAEYLRLALEKLSSFPATRLIKTSSVLETEPIDVPQEFADKKFLNQIAVFESDLDPFDFSRRMHAIEEELGRVRTVRNGPRTIDIDLIDFGGKVITTPELTLPHPRAKSRDFVMRPLAEIGCNLHFNVKNCKKRNGDSPQEKAKWGQSPKKRNGDSPQETKWGQSPRKPNGDSPQE